MEALTAQEIIDAIHDTPPPGVELSEEDYESIQGAEQDGCDGYDLTGYVITLLLERGCEAPEEYLIAIGVLEPPDN